MSFVRESDEPSSVAIIGFLGAVAIIGALLLNECTHRNVAAHAHFAAKTEIILGAPASPK